MRLTPNKKARKKIIFSDDWQINEICKRHCVVEDAEEWLKDKTFYGKALNTDDILEIKFNMLDFREDENLLLIHFKVLNSWGTDIFYSVFEYGKMWSLNKSDLLGKEGK